MAVRANCCATRWSRTVSSRYWDFGTTAFATSATPFALCATLTRAADLLIEGATELVRACKARALESIDVPVIECHVTNIFAREAFRHQSVIAWACKATMAGFGIQGYVLAITAIAGMTSKR